MEMKRILAMLLAASLSCGVLCGCADGGKQQESVLESSTKQESASESSTKQTGYAEVPSASRDLFAMDTYMTLTAYGERAEEALDAAAAEINRLDQMLSVGNPESEIAVINADGQGKISEETKLMLEESIHLYETTEGAFDITIYPLMEAWGFTSEAYRIPEKKELETLLQSVDSSALTFDENSGILKVKDGQGVDFGGIAKGFTSSRVMEIFEEYDIVSGIISLGGNVQCFRTKTDGSMWRCGIQNPLADTENGELLGIVEAKDQAVITSGGYERYFESQEDGEVYHHILDPATGYPANSGLISVTIVSRNGMLADGLSTSLYIMGLEKASEYWRTYQDAFDMILMTEDGQVYITEGLENHFTTEYALTIIRGEQ